ncbi:MAG: DMT family transporter [Alphaproteobacteria bacterium]|nr:DMT family transporter [Alphaproteobacteria bacterium]
MTTSDQSGPQKTSSNFTTWSVLIGAGAFWGLTFTLMKIALEDGAHPLGLSFWNAALGAAGLLAINLVRRRPVPLQPRYLKFYAITSILGTSVPGAAYFYAAANLPAGVLSISIAVVPMLTFIAAAALGLDRWSLLRASGVLLGIMSVALIVLPETALPDKEAAPWMLAALFAAGCYTAENIYLTLRRPAEIDPYTLLIGMFAFAAIMLAPVIYIADAYVPLQFPPGRVEWAILLMTAINAASYGAFIYLVGVAGPVFASLMGYLVTLSGVAWSILIFAEVHSGWIWAALAIMIAGLALVQPREANEMDDTP